MNEDIALWKQLVNWLWAVLIPVVWALWISLLSRVKRIEESVKEKASATEMVRLWEAHKDIAVTMTVHDSENRKRFENLQTGMGRIEGKIDALINRPRGSGSRDRDRGES